MNLPLAPVQRISHKLALLPFTVPRRFKSNPWTPTKLGRCRPAIPVEHCFQVQSDFKYPCSLTCLQHQYLSRILLKYHLFVLGSGDSQNFLRPLKTQLPSIIKCRCDHLLVSHAVQGLSSVMMPFSKPYLSEKR